MLQVNYMGWNRERDALLRETMNMVQQDNERAMTREGKNIKVEVGERMISMRRRRAFFQ